MLFWLLWFLCGFLAVGIANYHFRYQFPELYIENYWTVPENNERIAYTGGDYVFLFLNFLGGFISLGVALFMAEKPLGLCYLFRKWTRKEAMVLFPDNYNYETRYFLRRSDE